MEIYNNDEQQAEAIKERWKENGKVILVGATLGLVGMFGWRYFNEYRQGQMEQGAIAYEAIIKQLDADHEKAFAPEDDWRQLALWSFHQALSAHEKRAIAKGLSSVHPPEVTFAEFDAWMRARRVRVATGKPGKPDPQPQQVPAQTPPAIQSAPLAATAASNVPASRSNAMVMPQPADHAVPAPARHCGCVPKKLLCPRLPEGATPRRCVHRTARVPARPCLWAAHG